MLSVIVSVFNEMDNPYFYKIIDQFNGDPFFELLVVDGGSTDGTIDYLQRHHVRLEVLAQSTRGKRLDFGVQQATSTHLLLQHPRSLIAPEGLSFLKKQFSHLDWAAFTHQFDHPHVFLKFISWYSNHIRVKKKHIVYLDHCMVIKKVYLQQPIPDLAIFEDTALSAILREAGHQPMLLPYQATTSAIRFLERGVYKQYMLNQWLKWLYHSGCDDRKMNRLYEQQLNLNQKNPKI